MALLQRIRRLIPLALLAKVAAGASVGVLAALTIHPGSRGLILDGLRPLPRVMASGGLAPGLPPLPDPSNRDAASYWLSAYVLAKAEGQTFQVDQLLLIVEIAQAGRTSEPLNGLWAQVESLAMRDLGNWDGAARARAAAAKAPTWRLSTRAWKKPLLTQLSLWSGGRFSWHDEAASAGPEAQIGSAFLSLEAGPTKAAAKKRHLILNALNSEARQMATGIHEPGAFASSWSVWRLGSLLSLSLGASFLIGLIFAKGSSQWNTVALWALALCQSVVLGLLLPTWLPALSFGSLSICLLAPSWSLMEKVKVLSRLRKAVPLLFTGALILAGGVPLLAMMKGEGAFSYLTTPGWDRIYAIIPWALGGFSLCGAALKSLCDPEEAEKLEWTLFTGAVWALCAALLIAAAMGTALFALEQNMRLGIRP